MDHLYKLVFKDLVDVLPDLLFVKNRLCDAFQKGNQVRASFKAKNINFVDQPLQLLHMDHFYLGCNDVKKGVMERVYGNYRS